MNSYLKVIYASVFITALLPKVREWTWHNV